MYRQDVYQRRPTMSQMPAGSAALGADALRDDETTNAATVGEEMLPSGSDSSGLSAAMRQHLEEQVRAAGGNADQLVRDLRARIDEIDAQGIPEDGAAHQQLQAERALAVAQVSYLVDRLGAAVP